MTPEDYLKLPYTYIIIWDNESETWSGKIKEFPGCFAQGDADDIILKLDEAFVGWIIAALELGQEIPEPEVATSPHKEVVPPYPSTPQPQSRSLKISREPT